MNALSLFNDWLNGTDYMPCTGSYNSVPNVDVTKEKDSYILDMDLPGKTEADIDLELSDNILTISSKAEEAKTEEKKAEKEEPAYLIRERRFSQFRRSFTLPSDINEEKISADFKNGVLRVRIPRKTELLPHKIQIKSA